VKTSAQTNLELVLKTLKEFDLLLETDTKLPSVSGLLAGEAVRGSWWTHARSHEIFAVLQAVADHKQVLITKLVSGKVTFVHRRLWPDLLSIGTARESWQTQKLVPAAQMLLDRIDEEGALRTDRFNWPAKFKSVKIGQAVRELEKGLLIHSEEFHSDSGAHAKLIETWGHWTNRIDFKPKPVALDDAKRRLEKKLQLLNKRFGALAYLPWTR
jgi:hypothetical protein